MELFVTDLDGTLINSKREVPQKSLEILNKLIEEGVNFTVATARTPATAVEILQNLNLKLPVALMNGVLIYDTKELKYIDIKGIEKSAANKGRVPSLICNAIAIIIIINITKDVITLPLN